MDFLKIAISILIVTAINISSALSQETEIKNCDLEKVDDLLSTYSKFTKELKQNRKLPTPEELLPVDDFYTKILKNKDSRLRSYLRNNPASVFSKLSNFEYSGKHENVDWFQPDFVKLWKKLFNDFHNNTDYGKVKDKLKVNYENLRDYSIPKKVAKAQGLTAGGKKYLESHHKLLYAFIELYYSAGYNDLSTNDFISKFLKFKDHLDKRTNTAKRKEEEWELKLGITIDDMNQFLSFIYNLHCDLIDDCTGLNQDKCKKSQSDFYYDFKEDRGRITDERVLEMWNCCDECSTNFALLGKPFSAGDCFAYLTRLSLIESVDCEIRTEINSKLNTIIKGVSDNNQKEQFKTCLDEFGIKDYFLKLKDVQNNFRLNCPGFSDEIQLGEAENRQRDVEVPDARVKEYIKESFEFCQWCYSGRKGKIGQEFQVEINITESDCQSSSILTNQFRVAEFFSKDISGYYDRIVNLLDYIKKHEPSISMDSLKIVITGFADAQGGDNINVSYTSDDFKLRLPKISNFKFYEVRNGIEKPDSLSLQVNNIIKTNYDLAAVRAYAIYDKFLQFNSNLRENMIVRSVVSTTDNDPSSRGVSIDIRLPKAYSEILEPDSDNKVQRHILQIAYENRKSSKECNNIKDNE